MAKTINWANVSIGFDASKLKAGVDMSRQDLNRLTGILKQNADPTKQLERDTKLLKQAFDQGSISLQTYNRNLTALKKQYGEVGKEQKAMQGLMSGMKGLAVAGMAAYGIGNVRDTMKRVDEQANIARALNEDLNQLRRFAFQQQMVSGVDFQQAVDSLRQVQEMVGLAAVGQGKGGKILEVLGLDAKSLAMGTPIQQFEAISDAIREIKDQSTRAAIANKMFGDSKLVQSVMASTEELKKAQEQAEKFVRTLGIDEVESVEKLNDQLDVMNQKLEDGTLKAVSAVDRFVYSGGVGLKLLFQGGLSSFSAETRKKNFRGTMSDFLIEQSQAVSRSLAEKKRLDELDIRREEFKRAQEAAKDAAKLKDQADLKAFLDDAEAAAKMADYKIEDQHAKDLIRYQEELNRLKEDGRRIGMDLTEKHNPVAMVTRQLSELQVLLQDGFIGQDIFDKEMKSILDAAAKMRKGASTTTAPFIEEGTPEFFRSIQEANDQAAEEMERQRILQESMEESLRATVTKLSSIATNISRPFR